MSMLDSAGRSANVVTLEETRVVWMDREAFQEALQTMPAISMNLVRILAARVRLANELIQALASLDVYGRVARQLLAFAERYGEPLPSGEVTIPIKLTQGDIADLVGASRKRFIGTITGVEVKPYTAQVPDLLENGKFNTAVVGDRSTVVLTIEADANETGGHYAVNGSALGIGTLMYVQSKHFAGEGYCIGLSAE
jgi:alkanesulfonate monooxygenase SsuD/methylene tetrahydromethanopterin reductase-like flavin-dependent oxidoreductase (luciferase family)